MHVFFRDRPTEKTKSIMSNLTDILTDIKTKLNPGTDLKMRIFLFVAFALCTAATFYLAFGLKIEEKTTKHEGKFVIPEEHDAFGPYRTPASVIAGTAALFFLLMIVWSMTQKKQ